MSEYGEDYGEEPKLPDLETANEIYHYIRAREPGFKNTAGAINGRLSTIVNSKAFRNALAGFEIHDEPFHMKDENGEYIKEYDRNGNVTGVKIGSPSPFRRKRRKATGCCPRKRRSPASSSTGISRRSFCMTRIMPPIRMRFPRTSGIVTPKSSASTGWFRRKKDSIYPS